MKPILLFFLAVSFSEAKSDVFEMTDHAVNGIKPGRTGVTFTVSGYDGCIAKDDFVVVVKKGSMSNNYRDATITLVKKDGTKYCQSPWCVKDIHYSWKELGLVKNEHIDGVTLRPTNSVFTYTRDEPTCTQ